MGFLDPAEAGFSVDEDFLDFSFEGACEENGGPNALFMAKGGAAASASSSSMESSTLTQNIVYETKGGLFPEVVEEELEWLLNKDAFPTVESCFGILSENAELVANHLSPVSVLENSSSSNNSSGKSSSNGNGSTVASCCASFKIPTNHPVRSRTKKRTRKRSCYGAFPCQIFARSIQVNGKNKEESSQLSPPTNGGTGMGRRCLHCQTDKTPQWRAGPQGPKTLCNACGVRYKSGRLFPEYRPASSPTFSNLLHSNSHRKVVEMRRQNQLLVGDGIRANEACVDTG